MTECALKGRENAWSRLYVRRYDLREARASELT